MSIAYLLLVHNQPRHVGRLVRALTHKKAHFFIHVDAKVAIAPFRAVLPASERVIYLAKRRRVHWGGWSIVDATLELCRAAYAHETAFDRFQLLSGACYPIKSNEHIFEELLGSEDEFISINDKLEPGHRFYRWVAEYHCRDLGAPALEEWVFHRFLSRALPRIGPGFSVYKGWQWWGLSRKAIAYILEYVRSNRRVVNFFRYTLIPDETFIQTLIANSSFADRVTSWEKGDASGSHFVTWREGKPAVIAEDHREQLAISPSCFARKFDETSSGGILDWIDKVLRAGVFAD